MENRSRKLDLLSIGLLAAVIFLALALLTYNPGDPVVELVAPLDRVYSPDVLVYPLNKSVQNACGNWGALASSMLFTGLGIGAYYLVLSLGTLDVLLLMRRRIEAPIVRMLGWALSLVGLASIAAIVLPGLSPGPVIGSGGYLGALGAGLLEMHFATIGGLILATSLLLGGLLMCTDYALIHVVSLVLQLALAAVPGSRWVRRASRSRKDELRENTATDEEASELSVRILGKTMDHDVPEDEEEEVAEDASSEDETEDQSEQEVVIHRRVKKGRKNEAAAEGPRVRRRKKSKDERREVMQSLDEASLKSEPADYELPALDLLIEQDDICFEAQAKEVRRKAKILEKTFANFGFNVKVVEIETGPVIAQYEVDLEAGLRLSRITGLADDLAIALRVPSVRIVAPIPGKNTVGIEVPNEARQIVRLREVMEESQPKTAKMRIPLFLGKDVSGNSLTVDLSTLPHLLIAGRTGTGKSVCLNAIISSILMTRRPDEVRMLMIDPKMVELSCYSRLPHLMHPVVTDMRKAEAILAWAVEKMEERYSLLARAGVRHITSYNQMGKEALVERLQPETDDERDSIPEQLPFIVIVADEIADLMMTAGKEVEQHIIRLAQKSRAVGIHLILATQKPTVDVITGLIKSNLPARISFQVASRTDSRVVLDEMGAEKLLGNGDMLFLWPGTSTLVRGQGTYLSDDEINLVVDTVNTGEQNFVNELVNLKVEEADAEPGPGPLRKRDDLYESAVDVIVREGRGSVSLLQRALGIGYGRAARLVDFMAEDGIVGEYNGSQAREVLISVAEWEQMQGLEPNPETTTARKSHRSNVVHPDDWEETQPSPKTTISALATITGPPSGDDVPFDDELAHDEEDDEDDEYSHEEDSLDDDDQQDDQLDEGEDEYEEEDEDEDGEDDEDDDVAGEDAEDEEDEDDDEDEDEYEDEDGEDKDEDEDESDLEEDDAEERTFDRELAHASIPARIAMRRRARRKTKPR